MGVKGLWHYIEHHNIIYAPPKDTNGVNGKLPYGVRPQHLFIDMNALIHVAYCNTHPNSKTTLLSVKAHLMAILRRIQADGTLVIAFDGVAPVAKIAEQKDRRKSLSPQPPKPAPSPSHNFPKSPMAALFTCDYVNTEVPLRQEQITAGSEFVYACELYVVDLLAALSDPNKVPATTTKNNTSGWARKTWKTLVVSSCTEPGEGEVKIARYIRQIWQDGLKPAEESVYGTPYSPADGISIVGTDSDLILVALAATPYRHLTIVDPSDFTMTCLGELLDHWSSSVTNPPLAADLLPSWRLDFVFIMLLAGCDYYDGIRQHAVEVWRRYRDLRTNHGFYRKQIVCGADFAVDVNFLRRITEKTKSFMRVSHGKQKGGAHRKNPLGGAGSAPDGVELLRAALWNFKGLVLGRCVDYQYISPIKRGGEIGISSIYAAVQKSGIARSIGSGSAGSNYVNSDAQAPTVTAGGAVAVADSSLLPPSASPPLSALEHCIAVLGIRSRYSSELNNTIASFTPDHGSKLTMSHSTPFLISTVQTLITHVNVSRLSGAEKALHGKGDESEALANDSAAAAFMVHARIRPKVVAGGVSGEATAAAAAVVPDARDSVDNDDDDENNNAEDAT